MQKKKKETKILKEKTFSSIVTESRKTKILNLPPIEDLINGSANYKEEILLRLYNPSGAGKQSETRYPKIYVRLKKKSCQRKH